MKLNSLRIFQTKIPTVLVSPLLAHTERKIRGPADVILLCIYFVHFLRRLQSEMSPNFVRLIAFVLSYRWNFRELRGSHSDVNEGMNLL